MPRVTEPLGGRSGWDHRGSPPVPRQARPLGRELFLRLWCRSGATCSGRPPAGGWLAQEVRVFLAHSVLPSMASVCEGVGGTLGFVQT